MKRGEWHDAARRLRAEHPDWTLARIGQEFGVLPPAVTKALNPEATRERNRAQNARRGPAKREWERSPKGRGACERCGALKGIGAHRNRLCRPCHVLTVAEGHAALLDRVEAMWNEGLPLAEIARRLGRPSSVKPEIAELRKAGRIGYRYAGCESRDAA